ncbi:Eukaryotic translation initiation factor 3 like protein [Argiope bruennichi]|uniref:Eukaryotic translation initiation factor 3 like protein n=1 Tax=Argiope bruennichi TaxID=94029 RepID=A0A8T0E973_ARGBR|nr:Eukaryotic translation initiation factor 3 like protein [Argiope bruennichi]
MLNVYQNPENALKRADALYELGKQDEAMDCLYDALKNRKNRLFKHVHEAIINKLLEICVERKLSGFAKDGLYLYRIICQGVNIKSWEDAVKKLFLLTESKIEITLKNNLQMTLADLHTLEQAMIPENLTKISDFDETQLPFNEPCFVERLVVDLARKYNIPVRIDQVNKSLRFNNSFSLFQNGSTIYGPELYELSENQNVSCLSRLLSSLTKINNLIRPESFKFENAAYVMHLREQYFKSQNLERRHILERKKIIEKHKEMLENLQFKKEEERKKFAEKQLKEEEAERQRLQKEAEERANQRRIFEEEKIKNLICREKIENLKKSDLGQMIEKSELNELSSVDPESLLAKQIEYARREKKEFQTRLRKQERTINHMERAKRIEEIPLLKQEHEVDKIKALEMWECDEKCRIQTLYEERSRNIENKNRMRTMKDDLNAFIQKISERRKLEYEKNYTNFLKIIEKEKEKRLLERAVQRKAERRRIWLEQKEQLEKDNDKHFKFVRRRETKNNAKSSRERSTKKSPRCENFPEFRNEQNYLSPNRSYQAKINISNDNSTRSLPLRDNKVHMFNNHSERREMKIHFLAIELQKNILFQYGARVLIRGMILRIFKNHSTDMSIIQRSFFQTEYRHHPC